MGKMAAIYGNLGQLEKAEQLEEEVWKTRKTVLGSEHPDTLSTMSNLAFTWKAQERDSDAINLMLKFVRISNRVLGSIHPGTVRGKEWIRWQNESPDYIQRASESSPHAEEESEDWQDESLDHVEEVLREKKRAHIQ